jgi:hypothetical protein
MIRMTGVLMGIVLMCLGTVQPAVAEEPCETQRLQWLEAFDALKKGMEDYSVIKTASIAPRITELFSNGRRASMAAVVQGILKERGDRMAEAGNLCRDLAARERQAYDMWRKCGSLGQQRKNVPSQVSPGTVSKERDRLLTALHDLLLEEGYAQYKGYQAPAAAYGQENRPSEQRSAGQEYSRDDRWMGYQGRESVNPWAGYQGYYR